MSAPLNMPKVGSVERITLNNGAVRVGQILSIDSDNSGAMVRWVEYPKLPPEWVSRNELEN